jgi:predicted dehydrogenase
MTKKAPLRLGLIGCGEIGRLRASAISRVRSLALGAVSDLEVVRARTIAKRYAAAPIDDWNDLVHRDDLDGVIISTPPSLHADMCTAALRAGKHVLCEKPLARTPQECRTIVEAAEQSHRFLATGFNYRFYPSFVRARQLLDSGVIGELDHVRSYAGYSAGDHNHRWIRDVTVMGGGALRDNGIHLIDLTRCFLGEVAAVTGMGSASVWNFDGCEDNGFALLRSVTGKIASLHASWTEWRHYQFRIEIYGTRGCIRASCFPMLTEVVWARERGGPTRRRRYLFPMTHVWERLRSYRWVVRQSFIQELQAFASAVEGRAVSLATGRDGLRAVEIADDALATMTNGRHARVGAFAGCAVGQ